MEIIEKDWGKKSLVLRRRAKWAVWQANGPEIILSPSQGFTMISLGKLNAWSPEARVGARKGKPQD